ncbi:esterase-like activity of phytase family protein [Oculatella sp. FACHB-28]|uniref:esterase-like activity of phytase family protein n=1 Tax=Oculatella sp. FACHB-28 TaxID=2692845 RepID=UPI001689A315|nr:esterase-like activity of phytase family protein [Oculatella sp. FACHB-28]MBD2056174.1 esterase-like activity of phytase family protein [Oculatella sp. FACHB-28]
MVKFSIHALISASLVSTVLLGSAGVAQAQIRSFVPLNRYVVGGAVAEIIDASPDGNTLVFTNSGDQQVGFVDITDPTNPQPLGIIEVAGEPTSVAVTPDGKYAIAAVLSLIDEDAGQTIADQQPGNLVFIDLMTREIVGQVQLLGIGPDSIDISPDGSKVIVALEDEEDTDNLPGSRPGSINFVTINYDNPSESTVSAVEIDLSGVEGVNYIEDPQPEYVKFSPDGSTAAVTIQENNAIALIDVASEEITRIFSTGNSIHLADLTEDGEITVTEEFEGRREPDAIAFTPDGQYLLTVNEGDTELESFGDNIWSGGRGWTIFDLEGNVVYDSGSSVEELAVTRGQYPDDRSEDRGLEMEGGTMADFDGQPIAFVASERGSFVVAYDISNVEEPELLSFLPTGLAPEGVLAIPQRNLLLTSNEDDGTIDFFQASTDPAASAYSPTEPLITSTGLGLPFSAISGLHQVRYNPNALYAVPDNAVSPSRIYRIEMENSVATVVSALPITKDGEPVSYDLEGVTLHPPGGFWVVSEGDDREGQEAPNLLSYVNGMGEVQQEIPLPEAAAGTITRFGFEGVATNAEGTKVYVAIQREFEGDPENTVRIAEYDLENQTWNYYFYPLDTDNVEESWVGLSEIARDTDGSFLIVERDNQGGENGSANARIKRIYRVSLADAEPGATLEKTLVLDLLSDYDWIEEKIESLAVTEQGYWLASDNDGGINYTRMLFVPRP